jgi:hypothetical protein
MGFPTCSCHVHLYLFKTVDYTEVVLSNNYILVSVLSWVLFYFILLSVNHLQRFI